QRQGRQGGGDGRCGNRYLEATREAAPQALIVHDQFHCAKELNKAVDLVRRREHRDLRAQGRETLTRTKYLWLKNPGNWSERQRASFESLRVDTLKVGRAWAIKEAFAPFWNAHYTGSARKFFDRWYFWATHSRLPPVIPAAKTLKRHLPGLLAYTKHRITNAAAEGTNGKIQLIKANARGYRNGQVQSLL
ncbi:transposase, IS204/IS1001/IS1096/IS1165 family protein, partial [mine drainage metagenome]